MNTICKKEIYYITHTKLLYTIIFLIWVVALSPLTDYDLCKSSILYIDGSDYIHLLLCGASGFFPTLFITAMILCMGFMLHKQFKERTIFYEQMNGFSMIHSAIARFFIANIIVVLQILLIILIWMICSVKNGFHIDGSICDLCLKFVCLLVSGIHVATVTLIASFVFRNGNKAIIVCLLRYILGGLLWGMSCGGINERIIIQCRSMEPIMNMRLIFENHLIMDNYWIILSVTILSLLLNVMLWIFILKVLTKKKIIEEVLMWKRKKRSIQL